MHAEPAYARAALRAGASGYALKEAAQTELIEAVRQVAAGSTYINPELGVRLAREPEDEGPPDGLSEREAEIVGLVALGYMNKEIAERLFLSPRTIEAHRKHIQQKLRYETRAELVRYAVEHGLVELHDPG
jgi:two-component system response regulator NreC